VHTEIASSLASTGTDQIQGTLYTSATELVDEAHATIDNLRETSPITTFSSIFFGAF